MMWKKLKWIKYLPLVLLLVLFWSLLRVNNVVDFSGGIAASILTLVCFVVIAIEFSKSGDITLGFFIWEVITSVAATIVGTATFTLIFSHNSNFYLQDVFMGLLILFDAVFSVVNSFRTALRNWAASIGPGA
jgi:hypothetical protein